MGCQLGYMVGVAADFEVEPPALRDAGLPAVSGLIVFFGPQRRVPEIPRQHFYLLEESFFYRLRGRFQGLDDGIAVFNIHRERFGFLAEAFFFSWLCMWAIISSAVLKGPWNGPFSALSRRASMMRRCSGVYSSSAVGNFERSIISVGVMTILPRWKTKLTRSPLDRPACRRTLVGMVTWPLCWILVVVLIKNILVTFSGSQYFRTSCQ